MQLKIERIILTREVRKERNLPVEDDNTDVVVIMENGDLFIASFFSYAYIEKFRKDPAYKKQFLNGKYFWVKGMILIEDCEKLSVNKVIEHLIEEGDFFDFFY